MQSYTEENYLKIIYHLSASNNPVQTNAIAERIQTKAASVTDMIKKLADKELVDYVKYQGVSLTEKGKSAAINIVRKHRLWEVFLVDKLNFKWDEVHDVAEELEHIHSEKLINRLEEFLGFPKEDPHGDPIPDRNGQIIKVEKQLLSEIELQTKVICLGVKDCSPIFLQYLDKHQISLGSIIEVVSKEPFDLSLTVIIDQKEILISHKIASNLFVKLVEYV
jgi:DtxR family Mn-dependent transcriptional regulator